MTTVLAFGILPYTRKGQIAFATQDGYRVLDEQDFRDELAASQLLSDLESHFGCAADYAGISPAALESAQHVSVYDFNSEEKG